MRKIKWGVISTASIGLDEVLPAMQKGEYTELSAIASRSLEKAQSVASQLGIPKAYGAYEELLADPEIEAVYVPLPNHLHVAWSIKTLEAGKHVLCEKPLQPHDVAMADAALAGVLRVDPRRPPGIPVFLDPVPRDIVEPIGMLVIMSMKGEARMRGEQLQRIPLGQFAAVPLPAGDVARRNRAFLVVGKACLQALGDKLDLPAVRAQIRGPIRASVGIVSIRGVAIAALGKPAQ